MCGVQAGQAEDWRRVSRREASSSYCPSSSAEMRASSERGDETISLSNRTPGSANAHAAPCTLHPGAFFQIAQIPIMNNEAEEARDAEIGRAGR